VTPNPEFPKKIWETYSATPEPTTTTFRPWDKKSGELKEKYIQRKTGALT
jgi:hypothetical protein